MMNLLKLSTFLLAAGAVTAKAPAGKGKPVEEPAEAPAEAPESFPEFLDNGDPAPQCANWHMCDCFTCGAVTETDAGLEIQINHCKDGTISWMCCSALDGIEGECNVKDLGGNCEGAKCTDLDTSAFTVIVPKDAKSFTINTHDGKTAGDALNVKDICGGPQGGQGGSCATGPYTAHCLIDFDIYNDCGYWNGGDEEPAESPETPAEEPAEAPEEESPASEPEEPAESPASEPEEPAESPAAEEPESDPEDKTGGGFAQNSCSVDEWVPSDNTASPTGMVRCCAGSHGKDGKEYAKCDTSSCPNNFAEMNRNCFNFGAPQNGKNAKDNAGSEKCPYADSDHAVCDTSFYDDINPVACRTNPAGKNFQVHCLGKVKCNTVGVTVPKNGHSDGTADYDDSGVTECLGAMEGFAAGMDCFYDGSSENWKVCGGTPEEEPEEEPEPETPAEEPAEEPEPTPTEPKSPPSPSPSKGSGSGDPHFKTWTGDKYDYHGECDLVLVDNPTFGNGLGLRVHIRTTRVKYFSFIEKVAVQVGDDVLEFDNDVENFFINGKKAEANHKHHKTMLGGYVVRRDKKALSIRLHDEGRKHHETVAKIDLHTRKNGFPAVIVDGGNTDVFKGSLGLLGDWATGKRLARDGKTELNDHDATAFALEWQVRDTEPMLFKDARFPQFPTTCTPPAKKVAGRLGISSFEMEAEKACAHWKEDKEDCIFDVIATRDVLVAEEGHIVHLS